MLRDRGDLLKYALAHALQGAAKIVRGLTLRINVMEREAVAEQAVTEIRNLAGDPWKLAEKLPIETTPASGDGYGHGMPSDWSNPKKE
jgi:hypothetical protein